MNRIKERLLRSGSQYLNQYTLPRADEHFSYLYSLDKGSGTSIAEAYLSALTAGAEEDQKFNTVLVNRAIAFSKDPKTQKIFSEHYFDLSQKAKSTEKALEYLKVANRHGNFYNTELIEKKEQFELEKMLELVKKNEEKFGKAKHVRLEKKDEQKLIAEFSTNQRVYYFSPHDFKITDGDKFYSTWSKFVYKPGVVMVKTRDKTKLIFYMDKNPTEIYYWIQNS